MSEMLESGTFLVYLGLVAGAVLTAERLSLALDQWLDKPNSANRFSAALRQALSLLPLRGSAAERRRWGTALSAYAVVILLLHLGLLGLQLGAVTVQERMLGSDMESTAGTITIHGFGRLDSAFTSLSPGKVAVRGGNAYQFQVKVPPLLWAGQDSSASSRSPTLVLENGRALDASHALHTEIEQEGRGRYSHWGNYGERSSTVIFSSTDGTNPTENGRTYEVRYNVYASPVSVALLVFFSLPLYVMGLRTFRKARASTSMLMAARAGIGHGALAMAALVIVGLFLLPLYNAWSSGKTGYLSIGGYLPWSDAAAWLYSSYSLLHDGELFWWSARRPLHPLMNIVLAKISGQDLQGILILRGVLLGVACAAFARELWKSFGWIPAVLGLALVVMFSKDYVPLMMSESVGLTFGAAGAALALNASRSGSLRLFALGVGVLSLGLSIRPGPLLILPALVAWPLLEHRAPLRRRISGVALVAGAVAGVLAVSYLWGHALSGGQNMPGANAGYVLYGLTQGGKPWWVFFEHFPEMQKVAEGVASSAAVDEAIKSIVERPEAFLTGLAVFARNYFEYWMVSATDATRPILSGLLIAGLGASLWTFRSGQSRFLLLAAAGTLASAPFLFWDYDGYRTFIVTAPIDAALVAAGAGAVLGLLRRGAETAGAVKAAAGAGGESPVLGIALAGALVLLVTAMPALVLLVHTPPVVERPACAAGQTGMVLDIGASSPYIRILTGEELSSTWVPKIQFSDFHGDTKYANVEPAATLETLKAGSMLILGFDLSGVGAIDEHSGEQALKRKARNLRWSVAYQPQGWEGDGLYAVCGRHMVRDNSVAGFYELTRMYKLND